MELIGQNINGYNILGFIGQGGFGSVYKAEKNNKFYAIKIFREAYVLDEFRGGIDNRITREIKVMQEMEHPCLVSYFEHFDLDVLNIKQIFLVMEYIEGETLRSYIKNNSLANHEEIFFTMLDGIQALHNSNIIHRDLKPENIMIQPDGRVKILDYGLSKLIDYTSITSTGNILGTYAYMSPEQITDSKHIDFRSDLYALGVIFYEMLSGNRPYSAQNVPEFINKIKNELPIPPRRWNRNIQNKHENIILKLLEKEPYRRYTNVSEIVTELTQTSFISADIKIDLTPRFILRTYDDATVLETFLNDNPDIQMYVNYPINHQYRQKKLLKIAQQKNVSLMIDPATIRMAYDTYTDVKGLLKLPYCPQDYSVINPTNLASFSEQKDYVKLVIDEQVKSNADILTSPYHYSHNTNVLPTARRNPVAEWFELDIKLLNEAIDYRNNRTDIQNKPLYAGICLNALSLSDKHYKEEVLNTYSALDCEGYIIYADGIDKKTNETTLYHYVTTLMELQKYTNKPIIAGRLDTLGFGLICAGISGFTSGAARFESFYEDLYKEASDVYNMYERYYFPELLGTIAITRKDPIRLQQIINVIGACQCHYCTGKQAPDLIQSKNTKLHYLKLVHEEINHIDNTDPEKRIEYFISRIDQALSNYKKLSMVFKSNEYSHLERWKNVFFKIGKL